MTAQLPSRQRFAHQTKVDSAMKLRATLYFVLAAIGLIGTWSYNAIAIAEGRNFFGDWMNSGPAVSSLSLDILVAAIAGVIFIVAEARRIKMKRSWTILCLVTFFLVAFAFALPLFLGLREITLHRRSDAALDPAPPQ